MKLLSIFLTLILSLLVSGCFNTELVAPANSNVRVLSAKEKASYHHEYRNWYILWGAVPVFATQPEELIQKNHLTSVRVQTEDTVVDGIISYFTVEFSILPQTVVIEGNSDSKN